ncbi:MAG: T9SS type A sorting domain-containing protein [Bacteroidetes bacterium]|nr:T9SS type A sorting domain-containing protein [Bacteroidota bacterium]
MKKPILLRIAGLPMFLVFLWLPPSRADNVITSGTTVTVSSGTSFVSTSNLVIKNGATLDNAGTLILHKDLSNENRLPNQIGSGTAEFSGTTSQTITGENIIQSMIVNNSSGVEIGGNTNVNGTMTLINGAVSLGNYNLLLGPLATIEGTPSASIMIVVTGSGELRKEFSTGFTGVFTWPVGDDTDTPEYSPVSLNFTGGVFPAGNYIGVNLKNIVYPDPGITGNFLNRYWNITQSGITSFNCDATFQYTASDVTGTESMLSCTKVSPLPWVTYALTDAVNHKLTARGITSFGSFTGVKSSSPPVNQELANIITPNGVTTCYDATQVLTVAGDGKTFIVENNGSVTMVAGNRIVMLPGTKVFPGGYLYAHITTTGTYCGSEKNPLAASHDDENSLGIEQVIKKQFIRVYPNPTTDIVIVELMEPGTAASANVSVYSMNGNKLLQKTINSESRFQFSLSGKPIGIYMVHVQSGDKSEIAKVIKN